MKAIAPGAFGAALLASAAPLSATTIGSAEVSNVDQVGLVCNEYYGRCWRTRGPRYVLRYFYDPSYFPGWGYNYYAGPGYYDRRYGGPRFIIRGSPSTWSNGVGRQAKKWRTFLPGHAPSGRPKDLPRW